MHDIFINFAQKNFSIKHAFHKYLHAFYTIKSSSANLHATKQNKPLLDGRMSMGKKCFSKNFQWNVYNIDLICYLCNIKLKSFNEWKSYWTIITRRWMPKWGRVWHIGKSIRFRAPSPWGDWNSCGNNVLQVSPTCKGSRSGHRNKICFFQISFVTLPMFHADDESQDLSDGWDDILVKGVC